MPENVPDVAARLRRAAVDRQYSIPGAGTLGVSGAAAIAALYVCGEVADNDRVGGCCA
jgi:homoserine kinase